MRTLLLPMTHAELDPVDRELAEEYRAYQNEVFQECFRDAKRALRKAGGDFPIERALDVALAFFDKRCRPWNYYRNEGRAEHSHAERRGPGAAPPSVTTPAQR